MKKTIDSLINLNFKKTLTGFFIFSILMYSFQIFSTTRVGSDQLVQLGTAVNFIEGNSFSLLSTEDFIDIEQDKLTSWPYFYRMIAVPVLFLTNKNIELSFLILNVLGYTIFLLTLIFFIKSLFKNNKKIIMLGICFVAPFTTAPIKYMSEIGFFALSATLLAIVFLLKHWQGKQKAKELLIFALLVAVLPQMRYAYVPQAIAFLLFFALIYVFSNSNQKNWKHFLIGLIPFTSIIHIINSPYFQETSSQLSKTKDILIPLEKAQFWAKPFYAPFFNSFFPDFILFSFIKRLSIYASIAQYTMLLFSVFSILIFIVLLLKYLIPLPKIKNLFFNDKILETSLFMVIFTNLLFYIFIYRNSIYFVEDINSGLFLYKGLSVVNRYFAPIHISVFLLAIYYAFSLNKSIILKLIIFSSIAFSFLHFSYLRTVYSPFNRIENMNIVNNPAGSYNDLIQISKTIREKKESQEVFYISDFMHNDENFRQLNPDIFAIANATIAVPKNVELRNFKSRKKSVLLQSVNSQKVLEKEWESIYEGKIYSLYQYKVND